MKKILIFIILLNNVISKAQCLAPSNIIVTNNIILLNSVELNWTDNANATTWEVAVIEDFNVGSALPTIASAYATNTFFVFNGITPSSGCYAFFVRTVCSPTDVSAWTATGLNCSFSSYNWLVNLADNNFVVNQDKSNFQITPNPAITSTTIFFNNLQNAKLIEVHDILGKLISSYQTKITDITWQLDTSRMPTGVYIVSLKLENNSVIQQKLIVQ